MRDVAALAGVSLKTVSRVVNREAGVSEELVARVSRAAEQLDYRPNLTASNLRRADQRTGTIGLLVEDVANEFFASIHRGVEEVARQRGVAVIAASLDRDPNLERDLVTAFASRRVDGLLLAPTAAEQGYLTNELRSGWPMVCIDRQPRGVDIDAVVTDNREAAAMGVEHLIAHGHERIAFIGGQSTLSTERARYSAVVGILGAMLVPFIHLSVYMFRTIHPRPVVLNPEGPTMPGSFVATLLFSLAAFTLLYLGLVTTRYGLGRLRELKEVRHVPAA
jgi:LacI family transcriptional regulator